MKAGEPQWVGKYRGQMHQLYAGPYVGTRAWLVLATHPSWQPVLQNWNAAAGRMEAYPDFRFFTNGAYIPFEAIRNIDDVEPPTYVYGPQPQLVRAGDRYSLKYPDHMAPVEAGFAGFVEHASSKGNAVEFKGWAVGEKGQPGPREVLIFVGDTCWGSIKIGAHRPDIAAGFGPQNANSGFSGTLTGVPPAERNSIRAFVVLPDGTARELQYSAGYPFTTTGYVPGPQIVRKGPPTIYLHDKNAILPNIAAAEEKLSWSVVEWTPNHYVVRVIAPSDGYLLNLDNYNRHWKVRVDGRSVDILRANFTMQAIKLAKGDHLVEWRYDPLALKLGWLAFYLLLAAALVVAGCFGLRDRQNVVCTRA
jgi:hypothetical protein